MNSLVVSPQAEHDLAALLESATRENEARAYRLMESAEQTFRAIAEAPRRGAPVAMPRHFGEVRCRLLSRFPQFVVYYRVQADSATVLRLLRGKKIPDWRLRMALDMDDAQ